ncbi:MAG: 50S ribosomal protein L6 [Nanoarchaeota archaeon]
MAKIENKKVWKPLSLSVPLSGTKAIYEGGVITIEGPKGSVSKKLRYPGISFKVEGDEVVISTEKFDKNKRKNMFTYEAHIKNLVKGVTEGFTYKLAVVYAKFPVTVELKGDVFTVKNLLGEKVPRTCKVYPDVKVEIKGKDITITGIDKERTGQMAAMIEQLTRINHLDRRVIQDGIYITAKPHRVYTEGSN